MVLAPCTPSLPKLVLKPGRWTVGSATTCSYRIAAEGVQPRHALLLCGRQTAVLKAWDPHTWLNGQPVLGEVRLQPGDQVTVGSVEFTVEATADDDTLPKQSDGLLPPRDEIPAWGRDTNASVVRSTPDPASRRPDGWDVDCLRSQIKELRDELAQWTSRRSSSQGAQTAGTSTSHSETERLSTRIAELEQSTAESQRAADQAHQELAVLRTQLSQREAEWTRTVEQLQSEFEAARRDAEELREQLRRTNDEAAEHAQAWEQQSAEWADERERWRRELQSVAAERDQLRAEWDQRAAALQAEATHWQAEAARFQADLEQLRAEWQRQQSDWDEERQRWQDESARQQQIVAELQQALLVSEQALAQQRQQVEADRQQLEEQYRQFDEQREQLDAERKRCEQLLANLADQQRLAEQVSASAAQQAAELQRQASELEQQQAKLAREQQAIEHSWNWLQSDRRKLVEEKDEWQRQQAQELEERERFHTQRAEFAAERAAWERQRAEFEANRDAADAALKAARDDIAAQRLELQNEQARLQSWKADLDAQAEILERERIALRSSPPRSTTQPLDEGTPYEPWSNSPDGRAVESKTEKSLGENRTAALPEPAHPLIERIDPWSIGVDLTAPRIPPAADRSERPDVIDDWESASPYPAHVEALDEPPKPADGVTPPTTDESVDHHERNLLETAERAATVTDAHRTDPHASALREQLAELFHLPELRTPRFECEESPQSSRTDEPIMTHERAAPGEPVVERATTTSSLQTSDPTDLVSVARGAVHYPARTSSDAQEVQSPASHAGQPGEFHGLTSCEPGPTEPTAAVEAAATSRPNDRPVVGALESMSFADDEDVEDSVSRYMQYLLSRSQRPEGFRHEDRYVPAGTITPRTTSGVSSETLRTAPAIEAVPNRAAARSGDDSGDRDETSATPTLRPRTEPRRDPPRMVDKDALREATEVMRQVANQQTLQNIQASNRNKLKSSLKMKSSLAAFSFVLSAGLLYLGYHDKPQFLVLGACTVGLGVMTWVDLFIAIREARSRIAQLSRRKTSATGSEQP